MQRLVWGGGDPSYTSYKQHVCCNDEKDDMTFAEFFVVAGAYSINRLLGGGFICLFLLCRSNVGHGSLSARDRTSAV